MKYFDSIWSYNDDLKRFEYDCKLYAHEGDLFWIYNNKFSRSLSKKEQNLLEEYYKLL